MIGISYGAQFAWQLAVSETVYAKQEYIEKEQIFNGICGLEKVFVPVNLEKELGPQIVNVIQNENDEIQTVFKQFNLEPRRLRRSLRHRVGRGNYDRKERVVHRSEECKSLFNNAQKIAESQKLSEARGIHILIAILDNPGDYIGNLFEEFNVKPEEIKEKLLTESKNCDPNLNSPDSILGKYGTNLTKLAKENKLDSLIGRDQELLQLIRSLKRKKKNNPIIIGEAGVGKTALVRGLAQKIAEGNITSSLKNKNIIEMNLGALVAGTKYRGEFEERITKLIDEMKGNSDVIVFIDEIHTMVGAGKAEGSLDASNIIKPALAEGDLVIIGATTLSEYRKYFEKDAALERRFQPIMVDEPTIDDTISILEGMKSVYEEYHNVTITNSAIESAVKLSVRYIPDRNLPDKALDVIDEACSRKTVPELNTHEYDSNSEYVTDEDVRGVIKDWTGIPVINEKEEIERLLNIENELRKTVVGQNEAISNVSKRIKKSRSGIQDPDKPAAVFLFLGPTGVGKTHLVKSLASYLFSSEDSMIRLDMSEYMEKHSVSRLIGSPPGYKDHDEGGYLTNALRNKPYSIVLLDEIEKAHPNVFDIFLQVFDDGRLTDSKGNTVNAKNAIFIMTSNIQISDSGYEVAYGAPQLKRFNTKSILDGLKNRLRPEFLNRIDDIILFNPLGESEVQKIVNIILSDISERLLREKNINLNVGEGVSALLSKEGYDKDFGARYLKRSVEKAVEYPLTEKLIGGEVKEGDSLEIGISKGKIMITNENLD